MKYLKSYESLSNLGEEYLILWDVLQDTFDDFNIVQYNLHNDNDKIFAFKRDSYGSKHLAIHNIPDAEIGDIKNAILELGDRVKEATGKNISIRVAQFTGELRTHYSLNVYLIERDS